MINFKTSFWSCVLVTIIFFMGAGLIYAEENSGDMNSMNQWNFLLGGGYGYSESRANLIEVKAEIQFVFSSKIYFGLGIGYLSNSDDDHMEGNINSMQRRGMDGGMMVDTMSEMSGGFLGHKHDFSVIPLTAGLYYSLPVNSRLNIFMNGGVGYYWGSFNDITKQKNSAFGPHAGLGVEYKITSRITALAQGVYRFVNLNGFSSELHPGFKEGMNDNEHEEGAWHFHHDEGEYHFHDYYEDPEQMMNNPSPFNIRLNGFSLRMGIKFGF